MNFIADENIDLQIINQLRQDGHHIICIAEIDPGISDKQVLDLANQNSAPLLTSDRDFGELVFRQRRIMPGVILIRLAGLSAQRKAETVSYAIMQHIEELKNAFVVIRPGRIRIRKSLK